MWTLPFFDRLFLDSSARNNAAPRGVGISTSRGRVFVCAERRDWVRPSFERSIFHRAIFGAGQGPDTAPSHDKGQPQWNSRSPSYYRAFKGAGEVASLWT